MIKRLAAILDFATMVGPMTAGSGALKKSNKYVLVYMSAKFHACRQICTIPPFRAWTSTRITYISGNSPKLYNMFTKFVVSILLLYFKMSTLKSPQRKNVFLSFLLVNNSSIVLVKYAKSEPGVLYIHEILICLL